MRMLIIVVALLTVPGCTSILLGDASSGEGSMPADERGSAQLAADDAISAAIRRKLSADELLSRYAIGIRTVNGEVTLSGTVGSYEARDRAVQVATATDGVRRVSNRLIVNTNAGTY